MLKPAAVALTLLIITTPQALKHGCQDAKQSLVSLPYSYYSTRDMRRTIALMPQKGSLRAPDTSSVPVTGREREDTDREVLAATLVNPTPAADLDSSIARGQVKFGKNCIPCHGAKLEGNGPVAALFMPPPDLLAETTRNRRDGYIYSYIRHGGIVMPSYGPAVTAAEAWDLINYIRHMQKVSPR
jgi:mono/diheme cytochrome c family protein